MELQKIIQMLQDQLNNLKAGKMSGNEISIDPENVIMEISEEIENNKNELQKLYRQYDQRMLSRMAKNGIKDDEMMEWWMNRY